MEITARRTGAQLVLSLVGRMDGTGAAQVSAAIQQHLTDHDSALIFDMAGVDYLSSAGLRVFQESAKKMAARRGKIAVCSVRDFVKKLFAAGGFSRILTEYPDVSSALSATSPAPAPASGEVRIAGSGWTLTAVPGTGRNGTLDVTGSLRALHAGSIGPADVREIPGSPGRYTAAIGAMAKDAPSASPLLGEMVQAGGMVCWIPTDGSLTPDFFTPEDLASSGMKTYSLYAASFAGPFSDLLRITAERPAGMTIAEVYEAVFRYLEGQRPGFSGVCAVTLKATLAGLCSADLKTSVLAAAAGQAGRAPVLVPGGRTVTEYPLAGTVIEQASQVDIVPRYAGDTLISVGYGVDPARARSSFSESDLARIASAGKPVQGRGLFLYNKGMVLKNVPWDNAQPFDEQLPAALAGGEFVALHNLLNVTTVRSAVAGILPVSAIRDGV